MNNNNLNSERYLNPNRRRKKSLNFNQNSNIKIIKNIQNQIETDRLLTPILLPTRKFDGKQNNPQNVEDNSQNKIIQEIHLSKKECMDKISSLEQLIKNNIENKKQQRQIINSRNISIKIDWNQKIPVQLWVGRLFDKVTSEIFNYFIKKQITYKQAKALCCHNIIKNIISYLQKNKNANIQQIYYFQQQIMHTITHLCNKYPQAQQGQASKKVRQTIKSQMINNLLDDNYDMLEGSNIKFQYKQSKDYSQQIMKFINYIITAPFQTKKQKSSSQGSNDSDLDKQQFMPSYKKFHMLMTRIFEIVYQKQDQYQDINQIIDLKQPNIIIPKIKKNQTEQELQYQKGVKTYTSFLIGTKMSENTPIYTQQELESGAIIIKSPQILRIMSKWAQQLHDNFKQSEKLILNRSYRFKANKSSLKLKVNQDNRKEIYDKIKKVYAHFHTFAGFAANKNFEVTYKLIQHQSQLPQLNFLEKQQRKLGQFACKVGMLYQQTIIQSLSYLIHCLLKVVKEVRQEWLQNNSYNEENPRYKNLDINLITFKIGDLIRCKFTSGEQQIVRVFQLIKTLSNQKQSNLLKIIRIKDRLNQGTRDLLINVFFDAKYICEIQLAVVSHQDQRMLCFDKFNHFLYEIKRALCGPLLQMCNIWLNFDPGAQTFKKAIKKQIENKIKHRFVCKLTCSKFTTSNLIIYELPLFCGYCNMFVPTQRTIFPNKFDTINNVYYCGQCISKNVSEEDLKLFLANRLSGKIGAFSIKRIETFKRVKSFADLKQYERFLLIPINARKINFHFVFKTIIRNKTVLIGSKVSQDGAKVIYQIKLQITQQIKQQCILDNYLIYAFLAPVKMQIVQPTTKFANEFVPLPLLWLIYQAKSDIRISVTKYDDGKQAIFPYFKGINDNVEEYFIKEDNLKAIKDAAKAKKQVLELDKKGLTDQFEYLSKDIKIKIYYTLKQLYLVSNNITNLDFVQYITGLKVLHANFNQIKKSPILPQNIQDVELGGNQIIKIQGINSSHKYLWKLSYYNNYIQQISGLEQIPNLKQLYLLKNKIKKIEGLQNLLTLELLSLASNSLIKVQNLQKLSFLQQLHLSNNVQLQDITNITSLNSIKKVYLSKIRLNKIPFLGELINLESFHMCMLKFYLDGNQIKYIQNLSKFTKLQQLNLQQNNIFKIQGLQQLKQLKQLHLSFNNIQNIQGIDMLLQLTVLFLSNNYIKKIVNLENLTRLRWINLNCNQIQFIQGLQSQFNLVQLYLNGNKIKILENIDHINSLKQIRLQKNNLEKITKIPRGLKKIDVSYNKLTNIQWLLNMHQLQANLDNNKFTNNQIQLIKANRLLLKVDSDNLEKASNLFELRIKK